MAAPGDARGHRSGNNVLADLFERSRRVRETIDAATAGQGVARTSASAPTPAPTPMSVAPALAGAAAEPTVELLDPFSTPAPLPEPYAGMSEAERRESHRKSIEMLVSSGALITLGDPELDRAYPMQGQTVADTEGDLPLLELTEADAGRGGDPVVETPVLVHDRKDPLVYAFEAGTGPHRTLEALLRKMQEMDATELQLMVGEPPVLRVRRRMLRLNMQPLDIPHMQTYLFAILTTDQIANLLQRTERHSEKIERISGNAIIPEASVTYTYSGARYRCTFAMEERGPHLSVRRLPTDPFSINDLDLPPAISDIVRIPHGLVLITGATGSGKSTTQASIVDFYAKSQAEMIITIEKPVEFLLPRKRAAVIAQREVGRDTASFEDALEWVLRQDPDVIVIGEIMKKEVAHEALNAARTGHLVFATMHASSAGEAPQRLVDWFPADQRSEIAAQLASVLRLVTFQALVATTQERDQAVFEVVPVDDAVKATIRNMDWGALNESAKASARANGGVTLAQSVQKAITSGKVWVEEAMSILSEHEREELVRSQSF